MYKLNTYIQHIDKKTKEYDDTTYTIATFSSKNALMDYVRYRDIKFKKVYVEDKKECLTFITYHLEDKKGKEITHEYKTK